MNGPRDIPPAAQTQPTSAYAHPPSAPGQPPASLVLPADLLQALRAFAPEPVDAAVVLGSGLGGFADTVSIEAVVDAAELPGYPVSTIAGHRGRLLLGRAEERRLLLFQGRAHGYEGYSVAETALPARIAAALGARVLLLTNAAGGLDTSFEAGDLMLVTDLLVLTAARRMGLDLQHLTSDLQHAAGDLQHLTSDPQYMDMSTTDNTASASPLPRPLFDEALLAAARAAARESEVRLREGVYGFCSGPTYETRAEIAFYRFAGAQAVGMSTAPEVIAAALLGLSSIAVSCITNISSTVRQVVSHDEVTTVAAQASERLGRLLHALLRRV